MSDMAILQQTARFDEIYYPLLDDSVCSAFAVGPAILGNTKKDSVLAKCQSSGGYTAIFCVSLAETVQHSLSPVTAK